MCRRVVGEGVRVGWYQVLLVGGERGYDGGVLGCKRGVINGCQFLFQIFFIHRIFRILFNCGKFHTILQTSKMIKLLEYGKLQ